MHVLNLIRDKFELCTTKLFNNNIINRINGDN